MIKKFLEWSVEYLWDNPTAKVYYFFHWLNKCNDYSRILWDDRDWDYPYALVLLKHKLRRMSHCIEKNGFIDPKEVKKIQREIGVATKYIDDIVSGWSLEQDRLEKDFTKRWGKRLDHGFEWSKGYVHARVTKENFENYRKESIEYTNKFMESETNNWNRLFDYLKDHMGNWWD